MSKQDPILIAAPPRSGTTMLAGLLYHHGIWVGQARTTMYPGTNSNFGSENADIKRIMKHQVTKAGYKNWKPPFPDPMIKNLKEVKRQIGSFVPKDVNWLVKTSWCLLYWKFWREAYPGARWVFPIRDPLKIIDSMNRHPGMKSHPDEEKRQYIDHLFSMISEVIYSGADYAFVDIEKVADRDSEEIDKLFMFLKMVPDYEVINDWVKPEMLKR